MRRPGAKAARTGRVALARASRPVASGQCLLTPGRVTFDSGRSQGPLLGSARGISGGRAAPPAGYPRSPRRSDRQRTRTGRRAGLAPLLPGSELRDRGSARGIPRAPRAAVAAGTATGTDRGAAGEPRLETRRDPGQGESETRAPRLGPPSAAHRCPPSRPGHTARGVPLLPASGGRRREGKGKGNPARETPCAEKGQRKADSAYFSCLAFSWMALSTPGGAGGTPCWSRHVARCR